MTTETRPRAGGGGATEPTTTGPTTTGPTTTEHVRKRWRAALKAGTRRTLDELLAHHPRGISRSELAERVGIEATGTFGAYLSTLWRNGFLDERDDQLHAADVLFLPPGSQR